MQNENEKTNGQEVKREIPNQHLADRIAGKVDHNNAPIEEILGEVPEELPTHLGGIELENEVSTETETTTTDSDETTTDTTEGVVSDVKAEDVVSPQQDGTQGAQG